MTKEKAKKVIDKKLLRILIGVGVSLACVAIVLIGVFVLKPKEFTVYLHNGDSVTQQTAIEGNRFNEPANILPAENYVKAGWYTESTFENQYDFNTKISGDLHLYLKSELRKVTITFLHNAPAGTTLENFDFSQEVQITYGETFTLPTEVPACSSDLYMFRYWTITNWETNSPALYQPGEQIVITTPEDSLTISASWRTLTQTVHFDVNGGKGSIASVSKSYGQAVTLPDTLYLMRDGYKFVGWALSATATKADCLTTEEDLKLLGVQSRNITLYAIWEAK